MRQYCGVIDCMFRKLSLPRDRVEQGLLYRWTEHKTLVNGDLSKQNLSFLFIYHKF